MYFSFISSSLFSFLFSCWHMTSCSSASYFSDTHPCYWYRQVTLDGFSLSEPIPFVCIGSCTMMLFLRQKLWVRVARKKRLVLIWVSGEKGFYVHLFFFFFFQKDCFIVGFRYNLNVFWLYPFFFFFTNVNVVFWFLSAFRTTEWGCSRQRCGV